MATDINPKRPTVELENEKFGKNSNNKTIVRVEDESAGSLLSAILAQLGGSSGTEYFVNVSAITTPGITQTLINETVGAGITRSINKVVVVCRQSVKFEIKHNSNVIGSGRTGSSEMNVSFIFSPSKTVNAGDIITVEATQINGPAVDIECYLMGLDN